MEKIGFQDQNLTKIELNDHGDYVMVSTDSAAFFDGFAEGYKKISDMANAIPARMEEIEKGHGKGSSFDEAIEMSRVVREFSEEAVGTIDGIFGVGTMKKYFRNVYEEIPNFLPDAGCIMDFLEQVTPIVEKLFDRKVERLMAASKERMAKYQPQDHKRRQGNGTK